MSPRKVSLFARTEQPINWVRAFLCGMGGVTFMMAVQDIFTLMGFGDFGYEVYLGSLIRMSAAGPHDWTLGVFANWIVGGVFGMLYGYFFEFNFKRAKPRDGIALGLAHFVLAMVAIFPFFNDMHEFSEVPGAFNYTAVNVLVALLSHLFFGAFLGVFYGPVRNDRVRARIWEPGELGAPGDEDVITFEENQDTRRAG
jgi:hypothetical protein